MSRKLSLLICGSKVFDGLELSKDNCICVEGNKIVDKNEKKDCGEKVVELKGTTIMPGLIDSHVHYTGFRSGDYVKESLIYPFGTFVARALNDMKMTLMSGFTTIVDAGSLVSLHIKRAWEEGEVLGPRIVAAGAPVSQTFGHGDVHFLPADLVDPRTSKLTLPLTSLLCDGADECRKAARYTLRMGADFIKVFTTGGVASEKDKPEYPQMTMAELKAIVEEAKRAGEFVHAHAEGREGIINALAAGIKRIAHGIYMDNEAIELAKEKNAVVIPTLTVVDLLVKYGDQVGLPEWALKKAEEAHQAHIESIRRAYRAGVRLAVGTDFFFSPKGFELYRMHALEILLLVNLIGMSPREALTAATVNGAFVAGLEREIGRLKAGYLADLIAVKGDPLDDPNVLLDEKNIVFVMLEGRIVKEYLV